MTSRRGRAVGFIRDFQAFILKGNVVELAVAVIIGGAFNKIVSSFVGDLVMPLVNPLIPGGDWRTAVIGPGLKIGSFAGSVIDFLIIAFVLYLAIRAIERFKRKEEAVVAAAEPDVQQQMLATLERIADNLEAR
ncbi:large conductance mechanosensitive channel protein MscL [Synechococcus elongatus]|uniref:Large-conductance mechanosensitive channel n=2 Tax=Synechococcus elongatus TaxID=32046 RepID=MSCL_SYNE7|nr:large conductance mechanosensitive channel protein MscL [Synechococcus elongatus]Q31LP8.1 RecName: Full=Large-conductance mechanosensitive channel [Synechococcus elongatus PCC 7942 = FACHB-805]Q5N075.1 RecName: Full=Large-conductance mechanosensitive channel [Synechococcus elongatus PCC 6301]ABB58021.1 large conductance mechanosensitive channel protein [Synechococcus elongatus PCC 7942 = FACHB-805]AJD57501.1 mechanosensitive ion channel protein MscL [Synechococcus elongatus UTEX 2973]MBD258